MIICLDAVDNELSMATAKLSGELLATYGHTAVNSRKDAGAAADLTARIETSNKINAALFISIDCQQTNERGVTIHHGANQQALALAVAINKELSRLGKGGKYTVKQSQLDFPGLKAPVIVIKCTPEDLDTSEEQRNLATAILLAVENLAGS